MIEITSKREGFRRAGVAHGVAPKRYRNEDFSLEQLETLQAEPMLTVKVIDEATVTPGPAKPAAKGKSKPEVKA